MKPMNFPERKNQRRKGALARLLVFTESNMSDGWLQNRRRQIEDLERTIVPSARDVRTKKTRAGRRSVTPK